jgi:hypothetical protein
MSIWIWDRARPGAMTMLRRQLVKPVGIKQAKKIGHRDHGRFLIVCLGDQFKTPAGKVSHAQAKTELILGMGLAEILASIPAGGEKVAVKHFVLPDAEAIIAEVVAEHMEGVC